MPRIVWLPEALTDIERLRALLQTKSPDAAARATKAILDGAGILQSRADIGRPMDDDTDRREWFISFGSGAFVLRYRRDVLDRVVIIRVWHSREHRDPGR